MSEWCQNKECCYKKNQNQIRGAKGNKHYQSNKASGYYKHWCSMGCRDRWWQQHSDTCMNAVGTIDKQTVNADNAWVFLVDYNYNGVDRNWIYYLVNKLMGVKQVITREQAQTPEQSQEGNRWYSTKQDSEARPLAIELGLAS